MEQTGSLELRVRTAEQQSHEQSLRPALSSSRNDFINWFWINFILTNSSKHIPPVMAPIFLLYSPTCSFLEDSFIALAMTHFGRVHNDSTAHIRGRSHYARSLQQLRKAVADSVQSVMEETLACVIVICLIEVGLFD